MEAVAIVTLVGLFEFLATRFGTDTRDGDDWAIHTRV